MWHVSNIGRFPENAVQYALPKKSNLAWCNAEPQLYTAVCGLYAYGSGTSKQTFLLDYYSICEMAADGWTGTEIHFTQFWVITVVKMPEKWVTVRPGF